MENYYEVNWKKRGTQALGVLITALEEVKAIQNMDGELVETSINEVIVLLLFDKMDARTLEDGSVYFFYTYKGNEISCEDFRNIMVSNKNLKIDTFARKLWAAFVEIDKVALEELQQNRSTEELMAGITSSDMEEFEHIMAMKDIESVDNNAEVCEITMFDTLSPLKLYTLWGDFSKCPKKKVFCEKLLEFFLSELECYRKNGSKNVKRSKILTDYIEKISAKIRYEYLNIDFPASSGIEKTK